MAEETRTSIATLDSTSHIPIAQLTPLLSAPSSRSINAVVTLIWPYSSATKAVAFLLAEPDFRLRRTRGQVRVQFSGSSAKEINASGIESGDEVTLCLDGVEFVHGENISTPGRGVEFELRFTERLLLKARQQETHKLSFLDINHPEAVPELPNNGVARNPTPETDVQPNITSTPTRPDIKLADDEYSSPAFIKRARTSYGSLWEAEFEAEDGSVKGKGRKRTRMSDTWTVTTRELTPDSDEIEEADPEPETTMTSPNKPINQISMMDEGVQTEDSEFGAPEALLEFARQSINSSSGPFGTQGPMVSNSYGNTEFRAPPLIFTNSSPIQDDAIQMRPPSSPRLQPLSSENLPSVSPLLSRSVVLFEAFSQPERQTQGGPQDFPSVSRATHIEEEFPKSPQVNPVSRDRGGERPVLEARGDDDIVLEDANTPSLEQDAHPEHQYGNWLSQSAHFGFEPPELAINEQDDIARFSVEENAEDDLENLQSPISPSINAPVQHYPDLDEVLSIGRNRWEPEPDSIPYPELSGHGDNLDELVRSLSGPHSRAISRSVSAQSAVIDLTESENDDGIERDEEDAAEDGYEGESEEGYEYEDETEVFVDGARQTSRQDQDLERNEELEGSEDENEEYEDENETLMDGGRQVSRQGQNLEGDEESEGSEDEENELAPDGELYDEDDLDSEGNPYPLDYSDGEVEQFEDDEQEESHEEDDIEDELPARPTQQRAPIVIDLLSSDDEVDISPVPAPTKATVPRTHTERSEHSEFAGEDQSEEELDAKNEEIEPTLGKSLLPTSSGDEDEETVYHAESSKLATKSDGEDLDDRESVHLVEDKNNAEMDNTINQIPTSTKIKDLDGHGSPIALNENEVEEQTDVLGELLTSKGMFENKEAQSSMHDNEEISRTETAANAINENTQRSVETQDTDAVQDLSQEMEVDELEYLEPAPVSKQGIESVAQPASHAFGLDGADDGDQDRRDNSNQTHHPAVNSTLFGNPSRVPSQRPSLFSRIFSIDGANDEPDDLVPYPALPNEEPSPPSTAANSQNLSQFSGVRFTIGSAQLPTPDDSQLTHNIVSKQSSFTSGASTSQDDAKAFLEAAGDVPGSDIQVTNNYIRQGDFTLEADNDGMQIDPLESNDIVSDPMQEQTESFEVGAIMEAESAAPPEEVVSGDFQEQIGLSETGIIIEEDLVESQEVISDAIQEQLAFETGDDFVEVDTIVSRLVEESEVKTMIERTTIVQETQKLSIDEEVVEESSQINVEEDENVTPMESSAKKSLQESLVSEEPAFTTENPRRSHRRVKSAPKVIANKENTQAFPTTPLKSTKAATPSSARSDRESPMVIIDKRSTQKGHDASIELALSSLDSPEQHHDLRRPPMTDLKLKLNRNLRTELEEFKALKILRYELNNKKFNVLAIATTATPEPERAKNGPRQYLITFNITDPSVAPAGVTEVQIFRPYKDALPIIQVGDGVLLRDFQVVSLKNRGFGLKSDPGSSSWAVFKGGVEVEVRGPPVEYGEGEMGHMAQMKEWYCSLDSASLAKLRRANGDKGAAGAGAGA